MPESQVICKPPRVPDSFFGEQDPESRTWLITTTKVASDKGKPLQITTKQTPASVALAYCLRLLDKRILPSSRFFSESDPGLGTNGFRSEEYGHIISHILIVIIMSLIRAFTLSYVRAMFRDSVQNQTNRRYTRSYVSAAKDTKGLV